MARVSKAMRADLAAAVQDLRIAAFDLARTNNKATRRVFSAQYQRVRVLWCQIVAISNSQPDLQ